MKKMLILSAVLALLMGGPTLGQDSAKQRKKLMIDKLKNAQLLLEGLALNDFDKVKKSAQELMIISKAVEWQVMKTPRYQLYSDAFRESVEKVIQKAKAKDIDGVALGYVDMTLTCVKCHQYVREVRDARLPGLPPGTVPEVKVASLR
jgi:hypothetical protein